MSKLAHEIKRDSTKVGVTNEIIEIEGQQLKDQTEMIPMLEMAHEFHCGAKRYL